MAKAETFSGKMENAYGQPLAKAISFSGTYDAFESVEEIRSKNEYPSDDEIVAFVNNKRKANARQKSMQAALDAAGIAKPTLEDPQVQLKSMIKIFVAAGRSEDEARKLAEAALDVKLA
jgi:hypothetical protein